MYECVHFVFYLKPKTKEGFIGWEKILTKNLLSQKVACIFCSDFPAFIETHLSTLRKSLFFSYIFPAESMIGNHLHKLRRYIIGRPFQFVHEIPVCTYMG